MFEQKPHARKVNQWTGQLNKTSNIFRVTTFDALRAGSGLLYHKAVNFYIKIKKRNDQHSLVIRL